MTSGKIAALFLCLSTIGAGVIPARGDTVRINAGGQAYTDSNGVTWSADTSFSGGATAATTASIRGTNTPALYQRSRTGAFSYNFAVGNGGCTVKLRFAEIQYTQTGQRVFNVQINGQTVLSNFDIMTKTGAPNTAWDSQYQVNVTNGQLTVQFTPVVAGALVSAVEITTSASSAPAIAVALSPSQVTLGPSQSAQFVASVSGTANTGVTWELSPGIGTISSSGVYTAPASVTSTQNITVTARSMAENTKTASAAITLNPPQALSAGATLFGLHMDLMYNGDAASRSAAISRAQAVSAKVSRNSFLWHLVEAKQGTRDWSVPDAVADSLVKAGIQPLFCIYGSPSWANGVSESTDSNYYLNVPIDDAAFGTWVARYKDFVMAAVQRYKSKVKMWELWNEENEHYFWKPQPNVDRYITWYKQMYDAIKSVDPSAQVALGGITGLAASGAIDYNGNAFLQALYDRGVYPDIVAIHPYAGNNQAPDVHNQYENNFDDIGLIRNTMQSNGQGSKPVWVTEWGWNLDAVSESTQADYVARSLAMIRTNYPFVTIATYFFDYDRGSYRYGLYAGDFRMRDAGTRFKNFVESLQTPVTISVSPGTSTVAASGSQQFTATVAGAADTSVSWSVSPAVGSVSSNGLYVAPSDVTGQQTIAVIARSAADATKTASATITLMPLITNLLTNGNFEAGSLNGWVDNGGITVLAPASHSGAFGASMSDTGRIDQVFSTVSGRTYYVSGWIRIDSQTTVPTWGGLRFQVVDSSWRELKSSTPLNLKNSAVGTWTRETFSFTASGDTARLIYQNFSNGQFKASADDIVVSDNQIP